MTGPCRDARTLDGRTMERALARLPITRPVLRSAAVTAPSPAHGRYRLTEEQQLLRDAVRVLADERVAPRAADIDRTGEFPQDLRELLAAQDILALPFPEAFGGLGGELLSVCLAVEQLSRACATTGLILAVQALGALPILLAGSPTQQQRWIPKLASGESLIAFALTEAEAGSDAAATRTRAIRDGDDYLISGSKRFISHGSVADLITVFAVTDPDAPRHLGLSCFVLEVPASGFSVPRLEHKMGIRGSPTAELVFDAVRVPAANRLGDEGDGFGIAMRTFDRSRPGIAAQAVGIAQGALEVATTYAAQRRQFGQRVGDFQMVGAMLADMDAATEGLASCSTRPVWRSTAARPMPVGGRRCVNSWPGTRRCGSPRTRCRSWVDMATSKSSPSSA